MCPIRPAPLVLCALGLASLLVMVAPAGRSEEDGDRARAEARLRGHVRWVRSCLEDLEAIEAGMTRRDVEARLRSDGGLMSVITTRYTHPDCPYFKVDVTFDVPEEGEDRQGTRLRSEDRVAKISRPYLEAPYCD